MRQEIHNELEKEKTVQSNEYNFKYLLLYLVLMGTILVAVFFLFYYIFFKNNLNNIVKNEYKNLEDLKKSKYILLHNSNNKSNLDSDVLEKKKEELLSHSFFKNYADYYIEIKVENVGKANPFLANSASLNIKLPKPKENINNDNNNNNNENSFPEHPLPKLKD